MECEGHMTVLAAGDGVGDPRPGTEGFSGAEVDALLASAEEGEGEEEATHQGARLAEELEDGEGDGGWEGEAERKGR